MYTRGTYNDGIQHFMSRGFKPLADFLNDNLTKRIMTLEKLVPNVMQTFHGPTNFINHSNGVVNASITITQNDIEKVSDLIKSMQDCLLTSNLDDNEKDCADEDLTTIHTQIHNERPKKSIIERVITNIQSIINKFGGATQFVICLKELLELLGKMGLYTIP
jgi:chromosome condensin MukBEF ATPase and DNA-binding subunit MukB